MPGRDVRRHYRRVVDADAEIGFDDVLLGVMMLRWLKALLPQEDAPAQVADLFYGAAGHLRGHDKRFSSAHFTLPASGSRRDLARSERRYFGDGCCGFFYIADGPAILLSNSTSR